MYHTYNTRPLPHTLAHKRSRKPLISLLCLLVLAGLYLAYALTRPIPTTKTIITPPVIPALVKVHVPWPTSSPNEQSAYGAAGYGLLATSTITETPLPTASIAKVVTALAILNKKPLAVGASGPGITLSAADVAIYNQYVAEDGSVVPVTAGETITEQEGLQAMMLPSANNIADSMAIWAFGSLDAYYAFANGYVKTLGMTGTTITSASGFPPSTVATAADLVRLGEASLKNPTLSAIVDEPTADTPDFGTLSNVNALVGQNGINGIKTGNTDQAGGCFLATANVVIGGKTITVISAVMAAANLPQALRDALPLIKSAPSLFQTINIVQAGQIVGHVTTPWGASSSITASKNITATTWTGTAVAPTSSRNTVSIPAAAGASAGRLSLKFNGTTEMSDLELTRAVGRPGLLWRIEHPI
jgi:D-alanyl-D-alanine carboxypeptidase (penicillin-binding protein 5/6)